MKSFTDRQVKNLKPRDTRYEVWEGQGFGLRISPAGRKSWVFVYHFEGHPRRVTLGTYPTMPVAQARAAHAHARELLDKGIDPGLSKVEANLEERGAPTIATLAHEYLEKWAKPKKRSWKEDERIINHDVLPALARRKAKDVKRRDIVALLDAIVARGAGTQANRTLALIRKMYNFGIGRDLVESNPCQGVSAPASEQRRDRVLSEAEIREFLAKLPKAKMAEATQLALKLTLLTAQRNGEVVGATIDEFDLDTGWWTIPGARSKNGLPHRVPLSAQATELVERAEHLSAGSQWLFPSRIGDKPMVETAMGTAVRRNLEILGLTDFKPHDLRRTAASHMTSMGISRLVVSKILNHAESGVTAVYDRHSYDQEKRKALDAWGERVADVLQAAP